ncbi:MAG: Cytochrome oxidase, mono-heme subunit/FixO, partial [Pseudomonadota bacterium]
VCHTQMIRPLRAEVERYGHYSVAVNPSTTTRFCGVPNAPAPTWRA